MISIKNKYRLTYIYNLIFKENFKKKLSFDWKNYSYRYEIINKIIEKKNFKTYLEIGCFKDENFKKININYKVGVDPVSGGTIRLKSDDYFRENKENFDIIFVDGLHHYHQVKKDIENSVKILNKGGVVLVHDCLPSRIRDQMVPRSHENWNGDVWKSIVELRTKKNFDVYTCMADQGIGIIFNRDNKNILKINCDNFKKLKFKDYYYNFSEFMNIINENELYKIV